MSKVAQMRRYKGLTQKELADMFGISVQAYSRKERGLTAYNDDEKFKLKQLFEEDFPGITIDEIFFSNYESNVE